MGGGRLMDHAEECRIKERIFQYINGVCRIDDCPACHDRVEKIFKLARGEEVKDEQDDCADHSLTNVVVMVRTGNWQKQEFYTLADCLHAAELEHDDFSSKEIVEIAFQEFLHQVIGEIRKQANHHEEDSFWDTGKGFHL
jgi:hypothetical protein